MKKLLCSLSLLTAIAILFASCGTQMSIAKRHYNNGYYVSVNNKHKSEDASKETKASGAEVAPVTQVTVSNSASQSTRIQETTAEGAIAAPKGKRDVSNELTASATEHYSARTNSKPVIVPNTIKELKHIQAESKRIISENKGHNNSNGSLIWTIIVILLVLWLIALLTGGWGLGGIIYILLVIALILLVFKLLGLI